MAPAVGRQPPGVVMFSSTTLPDGPEDGFARLASDALVAAGCLDVLVAHQLLLDRDRHPAPLDFGAEEMGEAVEPEPTRSVAAGVRAAAGYR